MKEKQIREEIEVPEGVEVKIEKGMVTVKGKKGECRKNLIDPKVNIEVNEGKVVFTAKRATRKEKTKVGSYYSHVENMIKGASEGHVYKLKVCSGHFPMNASVSGKEFVVKNFLGEKKPRIIQLKEGVDVKVEGDAVTVESCSKELAGQTAADIEMLTKIKNRDLRIFQDGIYITEKDGKAIR
jgi:large subunit ribosomal protein L6